MTRPVRRTGPTAARSIDDAAADDRALFQPIGFGSPHRAEAFHDSDRDDGRGGGRHDRAVAVEFGATVRPTPYGRGPWDHDLLHGGPVVGLTAWASEQLTAGSGLLCARLTAELHHGVRLADIEVSAAVARASRRSMVVDATIRQGGRVVARSSSQWLLPSSGWQSETASAPSMPVVAEDPDSGEFDYPRPGFNCDAAELRYVSGSNEVSGPAVVWIRLTSPLIAGRSTSPFVQLATVADLAAAAGFERGPDDEAFINADVTVQLDRLPIDHWLALDARTHRAKGAIGHNEATVLDRDGAFGRILQSLVEAPRPLGAARPG